MIYQRTRERTLDMLDDALTRILAFGEVVDSIDFATVMMPSPQGIQLVGMLHINLKGPVLGTTIGNVDLVSDLGLLSSQDFIDDRVRVGLEAIREQRAASLVADNGSALH